MNRESSSHHRLIDDVLGGEDAAQFRAATLDCALAQVRRRRQRRQLTRVLAVVALGVCLVGATLTLTPRRSAANVPAGSAPAPERVPARNAPGLAPAPQRPIGEVELVNDQQLLDLFPNRPVALVGQPGSQRLVFLDVAQARSPRRPPLGR